MGSVIVGTNTTTNCRTLLSIRDQPLLQVTFSQLRVTLKLPTDLPSGISFEIVGNEIQGENPSPDLRIISGATNCEHLLEGNAPCFGHAS
jgi:hypothetical protein